PSRAAVGRGVREAEVGDDELTRIGGGDGEAERHFAVRPVAVAAGTAPAGRYVLIVGGVQDAGPGSAPVGGLVDGRTGGAGAAGDIHGVNVGQRHAGIERPGARAADVADGPIGGAEVERGDVCAAAVVVARHTGVHVDRVPRD